MADYLVTDTELTSVANAIRTKGGTSANLAFPTGFVNAINAIETGGSGLEYEEGTFTPTSDTASNNTAARFSFKNTHSTRPSVVIMTEVGDTQASASNSVICAIYILFNECFGDTYIQDTTTSTKVNGFSVEIVRLASGADTRYFSEVTTTTPFSNQVQKNCIRPFYASNRYYRAGKTYKWIAIWK